MRALSFVLQSLGWAILLFTRLRRDGKIDLSVFRVRNDIDEASAYRMRSKVLSSSCG
jgi:hypothetical protein